MNKVMKYIHCILDKSRNVLCTVLVTLAMRILRAKFWGAQLWVLLLVLLSIVAACDDLTDVPPHTSVVEGQQKGALYILCDGNFSLNNSALALYDFSTGKQVADFFHLKSGRKLGDTGNDMQRYGDRLYIVVNVSSQIEVLDARTGVSIKRIPLFNGQVARQPRYITFWEGKAYVCSFDGTVARIDTASLEVEAYAAVGRNPDGIDAANGKLYVSNSGGLDFGSDLGYDNTVSVVDIASFTEIKRITVGKNPFRVKTDDFGYVWVACRGDYGEERGSFWCLDSGADQVVNTYNLEVLNMAFNGNLAYLYHYNSATGTSSIRVFNLQTRSVERSAFITDNTTLDTPYGISVDTESGDVFITDAGNFTATGQVYCFRSDGTLRYTIAGVGTNPNTVMYVPDFVSSEGESEPEPPKEDYIDVVHNYTPAPGQFVGKYPLYILGDDSEAMRMKAEAALKGRKDGVVSLGRFGGSLTFSFKRAVVNRPDASDFKVYGNAFANGAEPGIVWVSTDSNHNGLPDDAWYELAGSDYGLSSTLKGYERVYYRPSNPTDSITYSDNRGRTGRLKPGYPAWMSDSIQVTGTLLAPTASQDVTTGYWKLNALDWGYADNHPNASERCAFDLDWAVNASGTTVTLDSIHFVRIQTGVDQEVGWLGELSTEITGAENLRH